MALIQSLLPVAQAVISILLIGVILLQQRGAGLGGAFGDSSQGNYYKRRGAELFLFQASIVLAILFAVTSLVALFLR
jgi:preprotein translocase subunit SecG